MIYKKPRITSHKINFSSSNGYALVNHPFYYIIFFLFVLSVILKFGFYHFKYYPILDDYIQYGTYQLYPDKNYVLFTIGTIFQRPFAAVLDMYLWGMFKNNLSIVFIIITILHISSVFLLKKALDYINIHLGNVFLIFCLLSPILSEATYWISASTRIVPGIFLASLSLVLCKNYFEKKKKHLFFLTCITHFLSYGFYEQTMVFSFCIFIFFAGFHAHQSGDKILSVIAIPIVCMLIFSLYYLLNKNYGSFSSRAQLGLSWEHIYSTAERIIKIFTIRNFELTLNGFIRGIPLILERLIYLFMIIAVSIVALFLPSEHFKNKIAPKLLIGFMIILFPFLPYFIVENSYPEFRSMYTAVIGAAIIFDAFFARFRYQNIICSMLIFIFIVANISEIHDYKTAHLTDMRIINDICSSENYYPDLETIVTGVKEEYFDTNSHLGAHIQCITSSDWALTGAIRSKTNDITAKKLTPVSNADIIPSGRNRNTHFQNVIDISHIN